MVCGDAELVFLLRQRTPCGCVRRLRFGLHARFTVGGDGCVFRRTAERKYDVSAAPTRQGNEDAAWDAKGMRRAHFIAEKRHGGAVSLGFLQMTMYDVRNGWR